MKFYITGGTGFIGTKLNGKLKNLGHEAILLDRNTELWPEFSGDYTVINMAGAPIFTRFTQKAKKLIYDSRIQTTKAVCGNIQKSSGKCLAIISASAVGYYGDRGETLLTEKENPGSDFLATVCRDWEATVNDFANKNKIRVVNMRTGYVLGNGGMLAALLPLFKLGLGGRLGSGKQFMPWIAHDDIVDLYIFTSLNPNINGPVNASAPNVITNAEFTRAVAKAVHRPAWFIVPKFILKLLYGELGELMTYSQNTSSQKIQSLGFKFKFENIYDYLTSNNL